MSGDVKGGSYAVWRIPFCESGFTSTWTSACSVALLQLKETLLSVLY